MYITLTVALSSISSKSASVNCGRNWSVILHLVFSLSLQFRHSQRQALWQRSGLRITLSVAEDIVDKGKNKFFFQDLYVTIKISEEHVSRKCYSLSVMY